MESTYVFSKMYDISGFFNFLYLPQIDNTVDFFILKFLFIENILMLFSHSFQIRYKK